MSAYILYTDKQENFECKVDVKNASLKNSKARLIVEANDIAFVFPGTISNGKCTIPIKKMEGLLDKGESGNIKLEIIVEDVYFAPWEEKFIVETNKEIKVQVVEQTERKPSLVIKEISVPARKKTTTSSVTDKAVTELVSVLRENNITKLNIKKNRKRLKNVLAEYFSTVEIAKTKRKLVVEKAFKTL